MVRRGKRSVRSRGRRTRGRTRSRVRKVTRRRLQAGKGIQQLAKAAVVAKGLYDTWAQSGPIRDAGFKGRRRNGSRTKKSMFKRSSGTGAYNQWSTRYSQAKLGRLTMKKLLYQSVDTVQYVWQKISRFGSGGTIKMSHSNATLASPTFVDLPCVAFELNSVPNWTNGAKVNYAPCAYLQKQIASGNYRWTTIAGQPPDNAAANNFWQVEKSTHNEASQLAYPNDSSIMKWIQIELELNGQTQNPTKWTIELCKFNEDVIPMLTVGSTITDGNYGEFWDNEMKQYTYSPLAQLVPGYKKKMKTVIRRWNVDLDPTASFENDARPHVKTFRIFLRTNRKCTYDWSYDNAAPQAGTTTAFEDADYKQEDQENRCSVSPKARMYLVVRASNYVYLTDPAAQTTANTPDMNIRVRTCHILSS